MNDATHVHEPWRHRGAGAYVDGDKNVCVICDAPIRLINRWVTEDQGLVNVAEMKAFADRDPSGEAWELLQVGGIDAAD